MSIDIKYITKKCGKQIIENKKRDITIGSW